MKVIAVLNQKGGVGKTTLSTNLARCLQLKGNDVIMIDSDPQGSATKWWQLKENHPLEIFPISKPVIDKSIKNIRKVDYIVIDGVPHLNEMATSAILAADFVLIPVTPSIYDIMASDIIADKVKDRIALTEGKLRAAFVINMAIKGTGSLGIAKGKLKEFELPILKTHIHRREIYKNTVEAGDAVFDKKPSDISSLEIDAMADEIIKLMI